MLSEWFYNKTIMKSVSIFGTLFNNISVKRVTSSGKTINSTKVPLSYAPRERFLALIDQEDEKTENRRVSTKLPRISFEIEDISYDQSRKLNKFNKCVSESSTPGSYTSVPEGVPYNLTFALNILSRTQDDALQILEQILPNFAPDYTVTANNFPTTGLKTDIPITLNSTSIPDDYEGDFPNIRDVVIWTLTFEMAIKLSKAPSSVGLIKDVDVNLFDNTNGNAFLEEITYEADSQDDPSITDYIGNHVDATNDDTFTP
jgi:hypothetical protein